MKIVFSFFLVLILVFCCEDCESRQIENFLEHDVNVLKEKDIEDNDDQNQETSNSAASTVMNHFYINQEVNDVIGFEDEEVDSKGNQVHPPDLSMLHKVLANNKKWAKQKTKQDSQFFSKHLKTQSPKYLWIGCSDSRLPANQILGLDYGEVFVFRNVANIVSPSDVSTVAVIQYAVQVLQVTDIIVAGHYGCGGVRAAVTKINHGPLEAWLSKLRRIRHKHSKMFTKLETIDEKARLLVEINVKQQVFNVASTPFVQQAWKQNKQLRIHGLVFNMADGKLIDLDVTMHSIEQLPEQLALVEL